MLQRLFISGGLVVRLGACIAQNLVPNPGFDNFLTCPVGFSQFQGYVANWVNPNTATPDYMHACANPNPAGMPHNGVGWQQTHAGSGYSGMYAFAGTLYREFIQVQLTTTLVAGVQYDFHMFVVLHNRSQTAIDDIGAYLSVTAPSAPGTGLLAGNPLPQIANPFGTVISDTLNWTMISGSYLATGGERWLTIGHFKPDALTTYQPLPYGNLGAYYYYDDVYLAPSITLPVELTAFSVRCEDREALLTWTTATERDNDRFIVDRGDGGSWTAFTSVPGAGDAITPRQYQVVDGSPLPDQSTYYRLRQIDVDGRASDLGQVVLPPCGGQPFIFDAVNSILIGTSLRPDARVDILDALGRVVRHVSTAMGAPVQEDLRSLTTGCYVVTSDAQPLLRFMVP
jgi:hypothetical protein